MMRMVKKDKERFLLHVHQTLKVEGGATPHDKSKCQRYARRGCTWSHTSCCVSSSCTCKFVEYCSIRVCDQDATVLVNDIVRCHKFGKDRDNSIYIFPFLFYSLVSSSLLLFPFALHVFMANYTSIATTTPTLRLLSEPKWRKSCFVA